ncbi:MAG: hypothetical protein GX629_10675 [Phycisphaerae bacterium]|nr:hypothetical protein [Phycisphaerae bacterium]
MLKLLQLRLSFDWSLSNLSAMLRMNLLTYRERWRWLDHPYETPVAETLYQTNLICTPRVILIPFTSCAGANVTISRFRSSYCLK